MDKKSSGPLCSPSTNQKIFRVALEATFCIRDLLQSTLLKRENILYIFVVFVRDHIGQKEVIRDREHFAGVTSPDPGHPCYLFEAIR
ncbi:hypothetical protein LIER_10679 [Lithospermum erythrorhizon]|uniref:Uncharacterized protein n=1 Tax=Lithospermum erythrorhizon TaxID=34254 RepID=A0AAV3PK53_LITER